MFWMDKKVLVTGSSGFIGSALCEELDKRGAIPFSYDLKLKPAEVYDVLDPHEIYNRIRESGAGIVLHLAAETEVIKSYLEPSNTYSNNVIGTLNVLEACRHLPKVKAIVIASSDKAYCCNDEVEYTEAMPLDNQGDMYSHSKKAADELAQQYARLYRMPIRVLRCANTYGPGQRNRTTLITGTLDRLFKGQRPVIHKGWENVRREWLYIDDAVEAYLTIAEDCYERGPLKYGSIAYNVGSGHRESVWNVVSKLCKLMDRSNGEIDFAECSAPQLLDQGLDSTKFRTQFPEWKTTPFDEGLRATIKWQKEHMR